MMVVHRSRTFLDAWFALAAILFVVTVTKGCHAQTLKIWPDEERGSGVTYGADVKLTLFRITNINLVNQKFAQDLGLDVVRIPMVPHWTNDNANYNMVRDFASSAKQQYNMQVFLSVANTNGIFNPQSGNLADAHNENKFPQSMKCDGCAGLYSINLLLYRGYIKNLINDYLGSNNIDLVGPWNEDPASLWDYTRLEDFGKPMVGVETWGLEDAPARYLDVESAIVIAGSHNYASGNDGPNLLNAYGEWNAFVSAGTPMPKWFTESTLFYSGTALGIAHMLPAISAGVEKMILYRAVPRLVDVDGSNSNHYGAVKRLIDFSKNKGPALRVETNDAKGIIASFKEGSKLHIHLCNVDANNERNMTINLQNGYWIASASTVAFGNDSVPVGIIPPTIQNGGSIIVITIPKMTYVHITALGLTNSGQTSPPTTANPTPSPTPNPTPSPTPPTSPSGFVLFQNEATSRFLWGEWSSSSVAAVSSTSSDTSWNAEVKGTTDYAYIFPNGSSDKRLYCGGIGETVELKSASNQKAQWKLVDVASGYVRLEHRKTGYWLQNPQDGSGVVRLVSSTTTDDTTKWKVISV